jgi:hypothetical protein
MAIGHLAEENHLPVARRVARSVYRLHDVNDAGHTRHLVEDDAVAGYGREQNRLYVRHFVTPFIAEFRI